MLSTGPSASGQSTYQKQWEYPLKRPTQPSLALVRRLDVYQNWTSVKWHFSRQGFGKETFLDPPNWPAAMLYLPRLRDTGHGYFRAARWRRSVEKVPKSPPPQNGYLTQKC
jgi:hypothetical protein